MTLHWWSDYHPLIAFAALFLMATALAWVPGFLAHRNHHPQAHLVKLAGWAWLFLTIPLLWLRPDFSVPAAFAWVAITIAAYVKPRSAS